MKIDESKVINAAKDCIDDAMNSLDDPNMSDYAKFYLGKAFAYLDVLGGCTDYDTLAKEADHE